MTNLTSVGISSGIPSSGTGTVSTIDQLLAVGSPISNGSSSVLASLVAPSSTVTSSMTGLVVGIGYVSSAATINTNATLTSLASGTVAIANGANTAAVTGNASAPTSSMSALVVSISPNSVNANGQATMANSAPVAIASDQTAFPINLASSAGTKAYVTTAAVSSANAALVVALSTFGNVSLGTSTVSLSSNPTVILSSNPTVLVSSQSGSPILSNANGQATMANSASVTIASNQSAVSVLVASSSPSKNFLWQVGAASSALLVSAFTIMSSEAVSLASSAGVVGVNTYGSSNTAQAIWADIYLTFGTTATTVAGANCAGWFANSLDGGTTFESTAQVTTTSGLSRPPDFVIPVPVGTLGSSLTYKAVGLVRMPAGQWKPVLQNNTGIITGSSSGAGYPLLRVAPYAEQY